MKVRYTTADKRMQAEVEGESQADVFEKLARFQEVFGNTKCGKCESDNTKFVTRQNDGNTFYEMRCLNCFSKLEFGQLKNTKGGLFPKRKNKVNTGGWYNYREDVQQNSNDNSSSQGDDDVEF